MSFLLDNPSAIPSLCQPSAAAFWFLLGVLSYQLVRVLSGYLELQSYAKTINRQALYMVLRALEEKIFCNNMKYRLLKENDFPPAVIEEMKRGDAAEIDSWKVHILSSLHTKYPLSYLKTVDAEEWREKFVKKERF